MWIYSLIHPVHDILSITDKMTCWLNNLLMVSFQLIRISSYAKNKLQMCWVTQHQCRSRQMWKYSPWIDCSSSKHRHSDTKNDVGRCSERQNIKGPKGPPVVHLQQICITLPFRKERRFRIWRMAKLQIRTKTLVFSSTVTPDCIKCIGNPIFVLSTKSHTNEL